MSIDRSLFRERFAKLPAWTCSRCQKGTLIVTDDEKIQFTPRIYIEARSDPEFEPDWEEQVFGNALQCQNPNCGHGSLVAGNVSLVMGHSDEHGYILEDRFYPLSFTSPPLIFPIAESVPEAVKDELMKSFSLFWSDGNSAANKVRNIVEAVLTSEGVKRFTVKNRKRTTLTTHSRIEHFSVKRPDEGRLLMGLKWKGNANSHFTTEDVKKNDLLDIFELMDHALQEIFDNRSAMMQKRAAGFTERKGRPPPKAKDRARSQRK